MQKNARVVESAIVAEVGVAPIVETQATVDCLILTQAMENYGAHSWDGVGECPQHWKAKFGDEYIVTAVPADVGDASYIALEAARLGFVEECDNESYREWIVVQRIVEPGYRTQFENDQLDYDGAIVYPAKRISWAELRGQ